MPATLALILLASILAAFDSAPANADDEASKGVCASVQCDLITTQRWSPTEITVPLRDLSTCVAEYWPSNDEILTAVRAAVGGPTPARSAPDNPCPKQCRCGPPERVAEFDPGWRPVTPPPSPLGRRHQTVGDEAWAEYRLSFPPEGSCRLNVRVKVLERSRRDTVTCR